MLKQGDYVDMRGLSDEDREKLIEAFVKDGAGISRWLDREDYMTRDFLVWDRDDHAYAYRSLEGAVGDAVRQVKPEDILSNLSSQPLAGITPEQMDEIKEFIVQTVKDKLSVNVTLQPAIGGLKADLVIFDDPAANDDVFEEPEIVPWEPARGEWNIESEMVFEGGPYDSYCDFGLARCSEEQAEKAQEEMRVFNRLLAYRDEFDPDFDFKEEGDGYYVFVYDEEYDYQYDHYLNRNIGCVYMSKEVAEELCRKLNNGEVVL